MRNFRPRSSECHYWGLRVVKELNNSETEERFRLLVAPAPRILCVEPDLAACESHAPFSQSPAMTPNQLLLNWLKARCALATMCTR
jgi:hypothetical protein